MKNVRRLTVFTEPSRQYNMKSLILLAVLCCSYAVEQHHEATKVPQELKEFVEQHIKNVKQQVPIVQQLIKDGKLKVDDEKPIVKGQELPEKTKEVINGHINKVLQHAKETQTQEKPMVSPTLVPLPPFVVEKITKLQDHVKHIMKKVEIHIPQAINQQIAKRKQMTEQAKPEEVAEKKVEVTAEIPQNVKDVVQHIHQHVPQVVHHHLSNKKTRSIKEDVKVPEHVQDIVSQVHQHIPQVIDQHIAQDQNKNGIVEQTHQHIPQVANQHMAQAQKKDAGDKVVIPQNIQEIVTQAHQHIPQVINQQIAQIHHNAVPNKPIIPANIQEIVTQAHHHLQQVVNQHVAQRVQEKVADGQQFTEIVNTHVILNKDAEEPTDIKSVVTKIQKENTHKKSDNEPSRVQEVIPVRKVPEVPQHVHDVVSLISQHIPQVINHQIATKKEMEVKATN